MSKRAPRGSTRSLGKSLGTSGLGIVAGFVIVALVLIGLGITHGGGHGGSAGRSALPGASGTVSSTAPSSTSRPAGTTSASTAVRSSSSIGTAAIRTIAVPKLSAAERAALPSATTFGAVRDAPVNLTATSHGNVVQIGRAMPAFATPGGKAIAMVPATQIGMTSWLPILAHRANWIQVRLPSRPNGATAWLPATGLRTAQTTWSVTVHLVAGTVSIEHGDQAVGTWPIGHGKDSTPTPTGQTFLLAAFSDPGESYSPVIYATGAHSNTLDSYGGGPGTVAVHGWPTKAGRIGKVSHGCVRVPADALAKFSLMPLGTPISITS